MSGAVSTKARRIALLAFIGMLVSFVRPPSAQAHPHAWIDVSVTVLFDAAGQITGLRQTWLFDEFYTLYSLEGLDEDGDGTPDPHLVLDLISENLKNLKDYGYFTDVRADKHRVTITQVRDPGATVRDGRLEMQFTADLEAPLDPATQSITYAIYDPTYYIEMLHAEDGVPIDLNGAPADCTYSLRPPTPTAETIAFAASLDRTQSGGDTLGTVFAERVTLKCTP